jgi:hypothetical protein
MPPEHKPDDSDDSPSALLSRTVRATSSPAADFCIPAWSKHLGQSPAGASAGNGSPHFGHICVSVMGSVSLSTNF